MATVIVLANDIELGAAEIQFDGESKAMCSNAMDLWVGKDSCLLRRTRNLICRWLFSRRRWRSVGETIIAEEIH